ncbi:DUF7344 domain-containing protein [Haloplanus sp. C73]|uniref:DUF7344 domain-containing protein n=1 Tax=Haloplanus sp. C73 TaxID=3421641 RepID=UPI003EB7D01E
MGPELSQPETTERSHDDLFSLLRNERRREVIRALQAADDPLDLRDLSEHIAAIENDCDVSAVTYKQRKRVQTALYQMHLPKLDERDVIEYDRRAGRVELAPGAADCLPYLDAETTATSRRWWQWYLGVAGVVVVPVGLAALGVHPFASIPGVGYATIAWAAFALLSIAYVLYERPE